jgi:hypothetical protein
MSDFDPARPTQTTQPASTHADTPPAGRNARGQFAPGNPGGPGRPPKIQYIEREILATMASALTAETWFEIAQAVIEKAKTGNMAAVQWLSRTFLTGKLDAAAAAAEVRLPPHVEMYELGCENHESWMRHIKKKRREAERKGLPDVWAQGYENPVEKAATLATTMPATAKAAAGAAVATASSAGAHAVEPAESADRVPGGFRVTKGASSADGVYRSNTGKGAGPDAPCAAR